MKIHNMLIKYEVIVLTHWGRVTHIYVSNLTIIVSDNDLPPGRRQANAEILLIEPWGINFSEISIEIPSFNQENAFEKVAGQMAAISSRPQCVNSRCFMVTYIWVNIRSVHGLLPDGT